MKTWAAVVALISLTCCIPQSVVLTYEFIGANRAIRRIDPSRAFGITVQQFYDEPAFCASSTAYKPVVHYDAYNQIKLGILSIVLDAVG